MQKSQELKVVVCGGSEAGKTQFLCRWLDPKYEFQDEWNPTIGASFVIKTISVGEKSTNLQIWDTSGQPRYASLHTMYQRGASIGIFIFDVSDVDSLQKLQQMVDSAKQHMLPTAQYLLVANKLDRIDTFGKVSESDIAAFIRDNKMAFYHEISAKTGDGLDGFNSKILKIAEKIQSNMSTSHDSGIDDEDDTTRSDLLRDLNEFISELRKNPRGGMDRIEAIVSLLKNGVEAEYPQQFFDSNLDEFKQHLTALQWTWRSMLNTVVNMVLTVLAALSIVGLPLMYCMGLWQPNAVNGNSLQHSFRFFTFGEKQALQRVSEYVAHDMNVSLSF